MLWYRWLQRCAEQTATMSQRVQNLHLLEALANTGCVLLWAAAILWNFVILLAGCVMFRLWLWLGVAQLIVAMMQAAHTIFSPADTRESLQKLSIPETCCTEKQYHPAKLSQHDTMVEPGCCWCAKLSRHDTMVESGYRWCDHAVPVQHWSVKPSQRTTYADSMRTERGTQHTAVMPDPKYARGASPEEPLIQDVSHFQDIKALDAGEGDSDVDIEEILCDLAPKEARTGNAPYSTALNQTRHSSHKSWDPETHCPERLGNTVRLSKHDAQVEPVCRCCDSVDPLQNKAVKHVRGGGHEEPLIQEVSHMQDTQASQAAGDDSDVDMEEIVCDPASKDDACAHDACDVSSGSDEESRAAGAPISLPSQWVAQPALDSMNMLQHDDGNFFVLRTHGDGACALHALWGSPARSQAGDAQELRGADIRNLVVQKLPTTWTEACDTQQGALRHKLEELLDGKWTDVIDETVQENEKTLFFNELPVHVRRDVLEYEQQHAEHKQLRKHLREKLRKFNMELFVDSNEDTIVRPLACLYGYINDTPESLLQLTANDARCALIEVTGDSFAILHACEQGQSKTKYQALFRPSEMHGVTENVRARFFHVTEDADSLAHSVVILEALHQLSEAPNLSICQKALLRHGEDILVHWFAHHREGALQWPVSCTNEVGWLALLVAFRKNYWFDYKDVAI